MKSSSEKYRLVVTDTGPLIALARSGYLRFLPLLFNDVVIPEAVKKELCLEKELPGCSALRQELDHNTGFRVVASQRLDMRLIEVLDPGEAEAISLAGELNAVLLIDEKKGRCVALKRGISIVGTGRILVAAKQRGWLDSMEYALNKLRASGYRLSDSLCAALLRMAGEQG